MVPEEVVMLNGVENVFCDVVDVYDYDVVDMGVCFDELFCLE